MKKVAFIYDFDKTLSPKDMQEYQLIQSLGFNNPNDFWSIVAKRSKENKCDPILSYMYEMVNYAMKEGKGITKEFLESFGDNIEFFEGVQSWFCRINEYGKTIGLEVEHYIISSGLYEIISHTPIAKYFKQIYACSYMYDDNNFAIWPRNIVNYTTKTQYLFRINKQVLDISDEASLNAYIPFAKRAIPFSRMAYFADGFTDIPVFKLIKEYGGYSVGIYNKNDKTVTQLLQDNRLSIALKADYRKDSPLEKYAFLILNQMAAQANIEDFYG